MSLMLDSRDGVCSAISGQRYYSPSLGRFINKDPIEEKGGINLYGFCGNNGVNRWDYLGNISQDYYHNNNPMNPDNWYMDGITFDDGHASVLGSFSNDNGTNGFASTGAGAHAGISAANKANAIALSNWATASIAATAAATAQANSAAMDSWADAFGKGSDSNNAGSIVASTPQYTSLNNGVPSKTSIGYGTMYSGPLHNGESYNYDGSINQSGASPDFWAGASSGAIEAAHGAAYDVTHNHTPNSNDLFNSVADSFSQMGLDGAPMAMVRGGAVMTAGVVGGYVALPAVAWFAGLSTELKIVVLGTALRAATHGDVKTVPTGRLGGGFGTQLRPPIVQTLGRALKKSPRGPEPLP